MSAVLVPETGDVADMHIMARQIVGMDVGVEVVKISEDSYGVRVATAWRSVERVCGFDRVWAVLQDLAGELKVNPYKAPALVLEGGLASDYWWKDEPLSLQRDARNWVRRQLLKDETQSDLAMDRFIASLDPPKREDLLRRARDGIGAAGF